VSDGVLDPFTPTEGQLRALRAVDYSSPVKTFLAESEKRYRFIRPIDLSYSIPLLIVLAVTGGLFLADALVPRYVGEGGRGTVLLVYGAFFVAVCGMGYYFS
jgi:hypothetical protein